MGKAAMSDGQDANGQRLILDSRTVDFLAERGLQGGSKAAVEKWLRSKYDQTTWPYETARAAFDWLETEFGKASGGPGALHMVKTAPYLLRAKTGLFLDKWRALQVEESQGGLGEHARPILAKDARLFYSSLESIAARIAFLRAHGVQEVGKCILSAPAFLHLSDENVETKMRLLREYGIDPDAMLRGSLVCFGFRDDSLVEKLRFFRFALRFPPLSLQRNAAVLNRSLDGNARPRIALLLQLGQPLPPPPLGDIRKKVSGGSLVTHLMGSSDKFVKHLVKHGHPTVRSLADYELTVAQPQLLAAAKAWEADRLAEAERLGLIPTQL